VIVELRCEKGKAVSAGDVVVVMRE
jgi:hypothetical protein